MLRARPPTDALDPHAVVHVQDRAGATAPAAEEQALPAVDQAAAWQRLAMLSPPLREALWLRVVRQLSYAEIASVQGVSTGTVMSRLHRARRQASRALRRGVA